MAKEETSAVVNSALTILSVFLIGLGVFFILTGVRDIFFNPLGNGINKTDNIERTGNIDVGVSTTKVPTKTPENPNQIPAETKALKTQEIIAKTGKWIATDYVKGDIAKGEYIVKKGDTLWEIAEAVYGRGSDWKKILANNKKHIGFLRNGSQALIVPGQKLIIT